MEGTNNAYYKLQLIRMHCSIVIYALIKLIKYTYLLPFLQKRRPGNSDRQSVKFSVISALTNIQKVKNMLVLKSGVVEDTGSASILMIWISGIDQ